MHVLLKSNWSISQVNYINAHATSTLAGDLAEINAIKKVFKNTSEIKINATKVIHSFILFKLDLTDYMEMLHMEAIFLTNVIFLFSIYFSL